MSTYSHLLSLSDDPDHIAAVDELDRLYGLRDDAVEGGASTGAGGGGSAAAGGGRPVFPGEDPEDTAAAARSSDSQMVPEVTPPIQDSTPKPTPRDPAASAARIQAESEAWERHLKGLPPIMPVTTDSAAPSADAPTGGRTAITTRGDPAAITPTQLPDAPDAPDAPARMPLIHVPGGWEHTGREESRHLGMTEAETAPYEAAQAFGTAQELEAAEKNRDYQDRIAAVDAESYKAHAIAAEKAQADLQSIAQKRDAIVADSMDHFQELSRRSAAEVDPDAYWKEKGTGVKVLSSIMIGLGEFASIMTGTPNGAEKTIQGAIDANIRAQQANIDNARSALDVEGNQLAKNMQFFGSQDQAVLATKINAYDKVLQQTNQRAAELGPLLNQANYQSFVAKITDKRAQDLKTLAGMRHTSVTQQTTDRYRQEQYIDPNPKAPLASEAAENAARPKAPLASEAAENAARPIPEHLVPIPGDPTHFMQAPSALAQERLLKLTDDTNRYHDQLIEMTNLRREASKPGIAYDKYNEIYSRLEQLGQDVSHQRQLVLNSAGHKAEKEEALDHTVAGTKGIYWHAWFNKNPGHEGMDYNAAEADAMTQRELTSTNAMRLGAFETAAGPIYKMGKTVDARGQVQPALIFTGKIMNNSADRALPAWATNKDLADDSPRAVARPPVTDTLPDAETVGGVAARSRSGAPAQSSKSNPRGSR